MVASRVACRQIEHSERVVLVVERAYAPRSTRPKLSGFKQMLSARRRLWWLCPLGHTDRNPALTSATSLISVPKSTKSAAHPRELPKMEIRTSAPTFAFPRFRRFTATSVPRNWCSEVVHEYARRIHVRGYSYNPGNTHSGALLTGARGHNNESPLSLRVVLSGTTLLYREFKEIIVHMDRDKSKILQVVVEIIHYLKCLWTAILSSALYGIHAAFPSCIASALIWPSSAIAIFHANPLGDPPTCLFLSY